MFSRDGSMSRGVTGKDNVFFSFLNSLNLSPNAVCITMITRWIYSTYNLCDYDLLWTLSGWGSERASLPANSHLTPKHPPVSAVPSFSFPGDFCSACLSDLSYPPLSTAFPANLDLAVRDRWGFSFQEGFNMFQTSSKLFQHLSLGQPADFVMQQEFRICAADFI